MHVTLIVAHPPFREGTGTTCYYNALALRKLGCDVVVYAPRIRLSESEINIEFYRYMPTMLAIGNAYFTPEILRIRKTDLIHLHFPFILGSELVLLKKVISYVPFLVTYHNDLIGGGLRLPAFYIYNRLLVPIILSRANKIIVTSYDYAGSSIFNLSIFQKRRKDVVEIHNGVDVDFFRPGVDANFVRSRHNLQTQDTVLLFLSSLDRSHARKGLGILLLALSKLSNQKIKLLIVGDGDMRSEYVNKVKELNLESKVVFTGRVPQNELPGYYAACDMVVIPSRPPEAFGLALAQGMAAGKPVIGSNIPGVRCLIQEGKTGFMVEPDDILGLVDRIEELVLNQELRNAMGRRGRNFITQHYTWGRAGTDLLKLYKDILNS